MGFSVMLWGAEKLVPAEYWCPYGTSFQDPPQLFCKCVIITFKEASRFTAISSCWIFPLTGAAKIMFFEKLYVWLCFLERHVLYPIVFVSGLTTSGAAFAGRFTPL